MIEKLIDISIKNRFIILLVALFLAGGSIWSIKHTPLDAIPDLSPPQVIVHINWKGQSPRIIEDQGTYPLVAQFLSIADIKTVRGYSTYENALIYIIFKDGVDLYWARSRVLEQLSTVAPSLPKGMEVRLGPDASGVGWAYEYALTSKTKNLAELRSLQDYYFKYALMGVSGVSEVASIGGFIPTYEIAITNDALVRYNLSIRDIVDALRKNNDDTGGRIVIENGYEWIVQARGYQKDIDSLRNIVVALRGGVPLTIGDIASVRLTPAARRGIAELDGKGEVVGGIVLVRYGEDVYSVIKRIKEKLATLATPDVEIVEVYDRSGLIEKALATLQNTLVEESLIVVVVIGLFLFHLRSALIIVLTLPLTIGLTFLFMKIFGIGSNIMSLGGIAIAIGAMVDASIVMIENAHKYLHRFEERHARIASAKERINIIAESSKRVGRAIFFALLLIVVSFLPIFALSGQEGLLFTPLAFTKTFAMVAGALLSITLVPVLMIFLVRGRIPKESSNLLNRFFIWLYRPLIVYGLKLRYAVIVFVFASLAFLYPEYKKLHWEFMPMLNEQSFMYMPVTPYGISVDQAKSITQKTDAIIKSFPEVAHVFGKAGRADTATDPAPLSMIESIVTFKPKEQWRAGMTYEKLKAELDAALDIPGLTNTWTYPIRGRIDMLLSGIRTPIGIKLYGEDIEELAKYAAMIEKTLNDFPLSDSVVADKTSGGYFIDIEMNEQKLKRYNLTKEEVYEYVAFALGGAKVTTMYKGLERYPVSVRLEESERRDIEAIKRLQIKTPFGYVPLGALANVVYKQSPSVIKSEMAKPVTFIYVTPKNGVSAAEYKQAAQKALASIRLPEGYYVEWAGQSEYLESAMARIVWIVPAVLVIILLLIYLAIREIVPTLIVFFTLPFALLGGLAYLNILEFSMSIAVIVGFLALLGVAAETAIVMIVYLKESIEEAKKCYGDDFGAKELGEAIYEGAVQRVRPKLMTVFAVIAGLAPIMYAHGVGSEVMQRIAAPMLGGVVSSAVLSLLIIPIFYDMYERSKLKKKR